MSHWNLCKRTKETRSEKQNSEAEALTVSKDLQSCAETMKWKLFHSTQAQLYLVSNVIYFLILNSIQLCLVLTVFYFSKEAQPLYSSSFQFTNRIKSICRSWLWWYDNDIKIAPYSNKIKHKHFCCVLFPCYYRHVFALDYLTSGENDSVLFSYPSPSR